MHSNKRVYFLAAAILIGLPAVLSAGFAILLTVDMRHVEREAQRCKALVPALYDFKRRVGRFPSKDETERIDSKLRTLCGYASSTEQFSMSLEGSPFNLQEYVFDSTTGTWLWD